MNRTDSILWTSISFDNQSSSNRRPAFENVNTINHVTNMPNLKMYDSSIKRRVFKNSWANYNHNKKRFIQRSHFCVCFDPNLVWICILCFCPSTGKKWTERKSERKIVPNNISDGALFLGWIRMERALRERERETAWDVHIRTIDMVGS